MLMKKNILIYMIAVAGLVLAGCNKTGTPEAAGSLNMTVKASIGNLAKVSYNGAETTFTKGDKLSLYAWTGSKEEVSSPLVVDGVVNTFDGEVWTPETQMLWKNVHDNHYFIAVSPAKDIVSFTADEYVLNPADYEANDLLIANELNGKKATPDFTPAPVDLVFSHALAKLNVNLKFRSQWAATPEVTSVATTAMDCYKVNYLTKAVTAYGDVAQVALQPLTKTPQTYALSFSGLQVPQDGVTVITVVIGGVDYVYTAAQPIDLLSGKVTTLGLIVGREELTLDEISVDDWVAEGTDFGDLEMEEEGPGITVGQVIGNDGNIYAADKLPGGVTAVAMICYVSDGHGLALALADEGQMDWGMAKTKCAAKTPTVPGCTWKLASKDEWNNMITATGGYAVLRDGFSGVGGTNMQKDQYWSSTGDGSGYIAWTCNFNNGNWFDPYTDSERYVRACLEF